MDGVSCGSLLGHSSKELNYNMKSMVDESLAAVGADQVMPDERAHEKRAHGALSYLLVLCICLLARCVCTTLRRVIPT